MKYQLQESPVSDNKENESGRRGTGEGRGENKGGKGEEVEWEKRGEEEKKGRGEREERTGRERTG